ncbi:hypothetical protein [Rhodococcus koreensis]
MNKNTLRTAITTAAITSAILLGIGAGTATAKPTLSDDGAGAPAGVMLGSDAAAPGENWTCTIHQGAIFGTETGTGLTATNKVVINPTVGDWQPGPVSGWCNGPQGVAHVEGAAQ